MRRLCWCVRWSWLAPSAHVKSSPASRPRHNTTRPYSAQKHTLSTPRYGQYALRMCTAISPGQWQVRRDSWFVLTGTPSEWRWASGERSSLAITSFPSVNCKGEQKHTFKRHKCGNCWLRTAEQARMEIDQLKQTGVHGVGSVCFSAEFGLWLLKRQEWNRALQVLNGLLPVVTCIFNMSFESGLTVEKW